MNISKLEMLLENEGIVFLTYGGLLSQSLIVAMTDALEKESEINDMSMKVSHNLLTIFIELSQNMMNYSKKIASKEEEFDPKGLIVVGYDKDNNSYYVLSRNTVNAQDRDKITPSIEQVLPLNKEELKKLYRELRKSGRGKHAKGAGIGFIEIARRCDKIDYSFIETSDTSFYFVIKAIIKNV
jgi:hypothetical protein